ncbi:MAG: IclR family transcriptional regulator [Syntrophobacterales bacterium]|nr:MAG: IclR family transcriptional regulator [Syntrophobacterales bacterium]
MAKREKDSYVIQSVTNALNLLEEFKPDRNELGVTELSKRLNLHKNNVFRLLATLEAKGYIEQNKATENYRLGVKSLELGQTFIKQLGLVRQAKPFLKEIVNKCNEMAYIGVIRQNSIVYLDVEEANQTVKVANRVGWRLPIHCTAIGKAQIAFASEEELEKLGILDHMERFTPNTIVDKAEFIKHVKEVAKRGYALDNEEYNLGVRCVGIPLRDYTGRVVGGISVSGPSFRMTDEILKEKVIPVAKEAGEKVSKRLGFGA